MQIDPVEQRTTQSALVGKDAILAAIAGPMRVVVIPTRAGIESLDTGATGLAGVEAAQYQTLMGVLEPEAQTAEPDLTYWEGSRDFASR